MVDKFWNASRYLETNLFSDSEAAFSEWASLYVLYNLISFKMAFSSLVLFCSQLMLSMKECKHLQHQKQMASYHQELPGTSSQNEI